MSECWDEGALRAYCDRELTTEDLQRIAAHLGECAECHARYNALAARATRVGSLMYALTPVAPAAHASAPRRPWVRPVAGAALALAAAAALAFVLIPKRAAIVPTPPAPVAKPRVQRTLRPIQAEAAPAQTGVTPAGVPAKNIRAKSERQPKPAPTEYFLALDDDPIDMGVVMRVALDSADAVQADVIFDADGRARAIRPVSTNSK